jgi:nucleoside-diphosphate-sugar epimerase
MHGRRWLRVLPSIMRIVIIGASGNVGTALLRRLSQRRPADRLIGVARRTPANRPPYDRAEWANIDVSTAGAADELARVFEPGDTVVNLAWGFQPTRDVDQLERVGVGGLRAVLDAAERVDPAQIVHMSSVGVYRSAPGRLVDESWPTDGVPGSAYSRHKAAAERLLDAFEARRGTDGPVVTRPRPGLIFQRDAGSELLRYGVPGYVPARLIRALPVLPMDRRLILPVVHADDVADAVVTAVERRAPGAFNLAAEPPLTRDDIAAALQAYPVHLPAPVIRAAAALGWHARLQRLSPGWIDLAFSAPLLDTARARRVLDWSPRVGAREALAEALGGMADGAATDSPVLRPRTVGNQATDLLRRGPITRRHRS